MVLMSSLKWLESIHIPLVQCQTLSKTSNFINDMCEILKFGVTITIKLRIFYHRGECLLRSSSLRKLYLVKNNLCQ